MPSLETPGKMLMVVGGVLLAVGALLTLSGKAPWLGRLPGDFQLERGRFSVYFPLATSILLNLLLTLLLNLFLRRR